MRNTQNNDLALVQENAGGEIACTTLGSDIATLIQQIQTRANTMNKKRRTRNDHAHWIARGRQQALRRASAHLLALRAASIAPYPLYLALQEYLACLDKCCLDAEEERHTVGPRHGLPIAQWKAEGAGHELPRIARALSHIVQAHTPDSVRHTLSLDGKTLVSLQRENGCACA